MAGVKVDACPELQHWVWSKLMCTEAMAMECVGDWCEKQKNTYKRAMPSCNQKGCPEESADALADPWDAAIPKINFQLGEYEPSQKMLALKGKGGDDGAKF